MMVKKEYVPLDWAKLDDGHRLTKVDVCKYLSRSRSDLDRLRRADPTFPKPIFGEGTRAQRWLFGEVRRWSLADAARRAQP